MKRLIIVLSAAAVLTSFQKTPIEKGMIWADCVLFETKGTSTSFKPGHGFFDELYTIPSGGSFANGVTSISEAKPGDMDYNGGRWHVNELAAGVDPAKYANACSVDDLDLADFVSTTTYFECPLLPIRRN
jgi:hypothetical protein